MRFSKGALAISLGIVWGLCVLLATWWVVILDSNNYHFYMSKLDTFYLGYTVSWVGGIIGFIWGFVDGCIAGFLIAWIYNTIRPKFRKYIEPEKV